MTYPSDAWYALRNALFAEEFSVAGDLLRANPALLVERDGLGETVLHFLAVEDCLAGVAWLHARGASLDTRNDFGKPVAFEVAELGYRELLEWFAANGCDLQQRDACGRSLADYLIESEKPEMAAFAQQLSGN